MRTRDNIGGTTKTEMGPWRRPGTTPEAPPSWSAGPMEGALMRSPSTRERSPVKGPSSRFKRLSSNERRPYRVRLDEARNEGALSTRERSPLANLDLSETLQANAASAAGAGARPTRASRGRTPSGLLDGAVIKGRRARDTDK